MNRQLRAILEVIILAALHFGTVYLAVSALVPSWALTTATIATVAALLGYLLLVLTDNADAGLPIALLYLSPIIYLMWAILWWGMRLLGLWPPRF